MSNAFGLEPLEQQLAKFYGDFGLMGPEPEDDDREEIKFDAAPPEPWPPPDRNALPRESG